MKRRDSLLGNKIIIGFVLIFVASWSFGQQTKPFNIYDQFLETQFWLGLKGGINATQVSAAELNAGFSPIDYESEMLERSYNDFSAIGMHMGLEMNFRYKLFSVSFQPTFKRSAYDYESQFLWVDAEGADAFEATNEIRQKLDIVELPLMFKTEIFQSGNIKPFLMAGGFYSIIATAQKDVEISQIDYSSGTAVPSTTGNYAIGTKDGFKNFLGVAGGGGVYLDYSNIRTVLELGYKFGLTPMTHENYIQNELASLGEVNDKLNFRDISFSISFIFPFRYIDRQFMPF